MVRHRKAENLSLSDRSKAVDALPKLGKDWAALYDKCLLTGEAGRSTVSPEQAQIAALRAELSRLKKENVILKKSIGILCARRPLNYAFLVAESALLFPIAIIGCPRRAVELGILSTFATTGAACGWATHMGA